MERVVEMGCELEMFSNLSMAELCINDDGYFKILHKKQR